MTQAPPLLDGESVVFDHVPNMRVFRRAALFLIMISVFPTLAFAIVFDDSFWVIVPMFAACVLLMQERFTLGRHRAWVTTHRIILQNGEVALADVTSTRAKSVYVKVTHRGNSKSVPLYYPTDGKALVRAISRAQEGAP